MKVVLVTHPSSLEHVALTEHPERPARVGAAIEGVQESGLEIVAKQARSATRDEILRVHAADFVDRLDEFCERGGGHIDADTYVVPQSCDAARFAAGAGLSAIEAIRAGEADVGFAAIRPPGHHAERDRTMGFCLLNNVAISAAHLVSLGARVAIVDWDVHHGNGTQEIFFRSPDVLYVSLHRSPFYPGTGRIEEVGKGLGTGATVNIPVPAGTEGSTYRRVFSEVVAPILDQFNADWVLVSAGYDAHVDDPIGGLRLIADDYRVMAAVIGRSIGYTNTVFFLEGGYDLRAISDSTAATLSGFDSRHTSLEAPPGSEPSIDRVLPVLSLFWDLDQGSP
jgi:acetoin utilization deacetylase AcuC-like enzyme